MRYFLTTLTLCLVSFVLGFIAAVWLQYRLDRRLLKEEEEREAAAEEAEFNKLNRAGTDRKR